VIENPKRQKDFTIADVLAIAIRLAATICCAVALAACAHHDAPVKASAEPARANLSADSLIVGLDDVRRIADYPDLSSVDLLDVHKPRGMHQYDAEYPTQCQVVFDQDVAFSPGWVKFRSLGYVGASNYGVTQAIAIYADPGAARNAFNRVTSELTDCSQLHVADFPFTVRRLDPSTVAECGDTQCSEIYRVKSSVLIGVSVVHFRDSERIANTVLQNITDRINTA